MYLVEEHTPIVIIYRALAVINDIINMYMYDMRWKLLLIATYI